MARQCTVRIRETDGVLELALTAANDRLIVRGARAGDVKLGGALHRGDGPRDGRDGPVAGLRAREIWARAPARASGASSGAATAERSLEMFKRGRRSGRPWSRRKKGRAAHSSASSELLPEYKSDGAASAAGRWTRGSRSLLLATQMLAGVRGAAAASDPRDVRRGAVGSGRRPLDGLQRVQGIQPKHRLST